MLFSRCFAMSKVSPLFFYSVNYKVNEWSKEEHKLWSGRMWVQILQLC